MICQAKSLPTRNSPSGGQRKHNAGADHDYSPEGLAQCPDLCEKPLVELEIIPCCAKCSGEVRYPFAAIRVYGARLLRDLSSRLQQSCASAGKAESYSSARCASSNERLCTRYLTLAPRTWSAWASRMQVQFEVLSDLILGDGRLRRQLRSRTPRRLRRSRELRARPALTAVAAAPPSAIGGEEE